MAKEWAKPFYNSKAWQRCRESYIEHRRSIDGGLCEVCGAELGYIVHHKILLTEENINDPTITLNPANLRWECKRCHDREEGHYIGAGKNETERNVIFTNDGDVILLDGIESPPSL